VSGGVLRSSSDDIIALVAVCGSRGYCVGVGGVHVSPCIR